MKSGQLILRNATVMCKMFNTPGRWKTPYERRLETFGKPVKGPVIPFGSMIEYHSICVKDQSRLHQFGKNVLPGIFSGCIVCGEEIFWSHTSRSWKILDASEIHARRLHGKEVLTLQNGDIFYIPNQMEQLTCLEEIMGSGNPPQCGTNP